MKDLARVSKEEQLKFLNSFDRILCDVDGVLLAGNEKIEGSDVALNSLRDLGKQVNFVSNNSVRSLQTFLDLLNDKGFNVTLKNFINPMLAIIEHLEKHKVTGEIFVIGTPSFKEELREHGFVVHDDPTLSESSLPALIKGAMSDTEKVGAVIVDIDITVNFIKMQKALVCLKNPQVLFVFGATDSQVPGVIHFSIIGPKYYQQPLEDLSGREAHRLAKPSPHLNEFITRKFQISDPSRVLMIGDSVCEDLVFATQSGYGKLLILSGITKIQDVENWKWPEEFKSEYYLHKLSTLHEIIASL